MRSSIVVSLPHQLVLPGQSVTGKAVFTLAKVSAITSSKATCGCTCLGHIGRRDSDSIISSFITSLVRPRNETNAIFTEELYIMLLVTLALKTLHFPEWTKPNHIKQIDNHLNRYIINAPSHLRWPRSNVISLTFSRTNLGNVNEP
jgi:hypothetical protein